MARTAQQLRHQPAWRISSVASMVANTPIVIVILILAMDLVGCSPIGQVDLPDAERVHSAKKHLNETSRSPVDNTMILPLTDNGVKELGFGLYTHVLLTRADRTRNLEFLTTLAAKIPQIDADQLSKDRRAKLNVFVTPNDLSRPEACLKLKGYDGDIRERLETLQLLLTTPQMIAAYREIIYDYDLAERLLLSFDIRSGSGPYLITYHEPVTEIMTLDEYVLLADLTSRHPKVFKLYVSLYLNQVKQPTYWDKQSIDSWKLGLAEFVVRLDEGLASATDVIGSIFRTTRADAAIAAASSGTRTPKANDASCTWLANALGYL